MFVTRSIVLSGVGLSCAQVGTTGSMLDGVSVSFLRWLFSGMKWKPVPKGELPATKIPVDGWVRVKTPRAMLSSVDSNLGGVLRVRLVNGIPIFSEPISNVDMLSEQDLSFTTRNLAARKVIEI